MATTAILACSTDDVDYARHAANIAEHTITVRFIPLTPTVGDAFTIQLLRQDGWGVVAVKTYTWLGTETNGVAFVPINLQTDCFDVDGLYRAVQGDYTATVFLTSTPSVVATSPVFTISIVSVREMRNEWLYGIPLVAFEQKRPKFQPRVVTGVTIKETSADHYNGVYVLAYVAPSSPPVQIPQAGIGPGMTTSYTLSWNGGTAVPIAPGVIADYVLVDNHGSGGDWIRVTVDPFLLPAGTGTSESIIIEQSAMKDEDIIRQVRLASGFMESYFSGAYPLEPRVIATDPTVAPFKIGPPDTAPPMIEEHVMATDFQRPTSWGTNFMSAKFAKRGVLKLYAINGFFNATQVVQIPASQWSVLSEKAGRVDFIPNTNATATWMVFGQPFFAFLFRWQHLPAFWHYIGTFGLRDLFQARSIVREAIAKKAAIETLIQGGLAYRAGFSSESQSRDGVSQSVSYTASAMFGPFSHSIKPYDDWLHDNLPSIKNRIMGVRMFTLQ